jgi:hypothetical protein
LFISENRGVIAGSIPKGETASTEIPNAVFAEGRKSPIVCFGACTSSGASDYAEPGITAISKSNGLRYRQTVQPGEVQNSFPVEVN